MKKIKTQVNFEENAIEAASRRIKDRKYDLFEDQDVSNLIRPILQNKEIFNLSVPVVSSLLMSNKETSQIKNIKYIVNANNIKLLELKRLNSFLEEDYNNYFVQLENKVSSLVSFINEDEIKILEQVDKVHHNRFVRPIDQIDISNKSEFNIDFKTKFSFNSKEYCNVINGVGATLPVDAFYNIPIAKAFILHEKTDSGDTKRVIQKNSIENIFKKNKAFNYVVMRSEEDSSSRVYKRQTSLPEFPYSCISNFTFCIEFNSRTYFNNIELISASCIGYEIKSIEAINDKNEYIDLNFDIIEVREKISLYTPIISTKRLRITLQQKNIVGRSKAPIKESNEAIINFILESFNFSSKVSTIDDDVIGYYQDFSIKSVKARLLKFKRKGVFLSKEIDIDGMYSFEIDKEQIMSVDKLLLESQEYFEGKEQFTFLEENKSLIEMYGCVTLYDKDKEIYSGVIPVKDFSNIQREYISPTNQFSRLKLFPDLRKGLDIVEIESVEYVVGMERADLSHTASTFYFEKSGIIRKEIGIKFHPSKCYQVIVFDEDGKLAENEFSGNSDFLNPLDYIHYDDGGPYTSDYIKITFKSEIPWKVGEEIGFFSKSKGFIGTGLVRIIDDNKTLLLFAKEIDIDATKLNSITSSLETFSFSAFKINESLPLRIWEDGKELKIGEDYFISPNNGSSWFSYLPLSSEYEDFYTNAKAGNFFIKFVDPKMDAFYLCEYTPKKDQLLDKSNKFYLKNGFVKIQEELKGKKGKIRTMAIFRSSTSEIYNTPILLSYFLKIYQNGLAEKNNISYGKNYNVSLKRFNQDGIK